MKNYIKTIKRMEDSVLKHYHNKTTEMIEIFSEESKKFANDSKEMLVIKANIYGMRMLLKEYERELKNRKLI